MESVKVMLHTFSVLAMDGSGWSASQGKSTHYPLDRDYVSSITSGGQRGVERNPTPGGNEHYPVSS
jgi:hypothetical protein